MIVEWTTTARDRLADVYVRLTLEEQRAFPQVIAELESRLRQGAQFLGESRATPSERAWFTGKLCLVYRLVPDRGVVIGYVRPLKHGAVNDDPE